MYFSIHLIIKICLLGFLTKILCVFNNVGFAAHLPLPDFDMKNCFGVSIMVILVVILSSIDEIYDVVWPEGCKTLIMLVHNAIAASVLDFNFIRVDLVFFFFFEGM